VCPLAYSATKWQTAQKAASFKTQGILSLLTGTRTGESKYEVVAGARRLRAAKLAELENLSFRVVKLTDAEAIEVQCVELSVVRKSSLCQKVDDHVVSMQTTWQVFLIFARGVGL
jgi:hypothetical protein